MSCVLRIGGPELDVDSLIKDLDLEDWAIAVHRSGESRLLARPEEKYNESGFHLVISDAGFTEFDKQIEEAIECLTNDIVLFRELRDYRGVENSMLDFGVEWPSGAFVMTRGFPPSLARLAGECGIYLCISHYPPSEATSRDDVSTPPL